jgi:aldose 1-epimerase
MKTRIWLGFVLVLAAVFMTGCMQIGAMDIKTEPFGKTPDGQAVDLYTLTNRNGLKAKVTNYGAILVSVEVPDQQGNLADVTLGYDNLEQYIKRGSFFGATVGRYANRIGGAKFTIDGVEYKLAANNGPNHIHGGRKGFDKVLWKLEEIKAQRHRGTEAQRHKGTEAQRHKGTEAQSDEAFVRLSYLSKDGEEGYPGNLTCTLTYILTNDNELKISYQAETDKPTIVNLTNHSYWNLAGQGNGDVLGHELMLNADRYTVFGEGLIPTGEIASVKGTPLDFTEPTTIGARIKEVGSGYDHNYVLNSAREIMDSGSSPHEITASPISRGKLALCARVYEPTSGRVMEVHTTEPGVQLYTANHLDLIGKAGKAYKNHYGFCLETQHFPDSPNKPHFPSVVLKPGEKFTSLTVHKFYDK